MEGEGYMSVTSVEFVDPTKCLCGYSIHGDGCMGIVIIMVAC